MKDVLKANANVTANSQQIDLLKQHFPQCFDKDGAFRADKMQEIVGEAGLDLSQESYSLNWLGKSYARLLANENPLTLLKEDKEHNQKPEHKNSQNLLIKGDNLEVLKHMVNAYREKVKMIYIDPPYNTGSDGFVYQDDRKFTPQQLVKLAGVELDEAKRILDFTQRKANSHSAWLTFMYPRLYIARQLLKDDGVIFISIDDNEQSQLRLLCDEVFGEENLVSQLAIISNPRGRAQDKYFATNHESLLVYSKSILEKNALNLPKDQKQIEKEYPCSEHGRYYRTLELRNTHREFGKHNRPNLFYPFYVEPETGVVSLDKGKGNDKVLPIWNDGFEGCWTWGKGKAQNELSLLQSNKVNGSWKIYVKDFAEGSTRKLKTSLDNKFYYTDKGQATFNHLFGVKEKIFHSPKPLGLLLDLINCATHNGQLILDFFSGSGTTAHAVMALNAEDDGNRKHISVQLDEATDKKSEAYKAGYKTIFDITKARIEKAAKKIKNEHTDYQGDLGFKLFETAPVFQGYLDEMETLNDQAELFDGSRLSEEQLTTLLTTWRAYDGFAWTHEGEWIRLKQYPAYLIDDTLYCIQSGFETEDLMELLRRLQEEDDFAPKKLIVFGYNFESKHLREMKEAFAQFKNKKSIEIDCEVRH